MYFDGSGDYLSIPASSDFDLTTNNTLEAWVYCTTGVAQGVMSYSTTATPTIGTQVSYIWFITAAGTLRFDVNGTGGATETTITTATIPSNVWTHIAVVKNGTSITQYINGVSSSTATFSGVGNTTSAAWSFRVGTYYTSALSFNGYVDDARVTKGVARYTSNFTVPSAPFSENTTIDPYYNNVVLLLHGDGVNASTNFIDSSPTPKTISVFGNTKVSTTQSKFTVDTNISGYIVTSVPGGITATGVSSPITVNGLENGVDYTFNVRAITADTHYSNVSLLLHGNGSNGSTSIVDSSQSPKTISVVGNAQISTAQSKFGGSSLYFDGSGDYLSVPHNTAFSIQSGDFTLDAWVYLPVGGAESYILSKRDATSSINGWGWRINATNTLQFYYVAGSSLTSTVTVQSSMWNHIATVRSGTTLTHYINGTSAGSSTISSGVENTSTTLKVGTSNDLTTFFNGYIDELRIVKGEALYKSSFAPPTTAYELTDGPVSAQSNKLTPTDIDPYYSSVSLLLHCDGTNGSTSFVDSSSSPKSVTSAGSAQMSTTKSKFGGSSMYFNGSNYATIPTNTAFDFGTSDFTLEAFVNLPTISGTKIVIGRQEPSNGMALQLWISNNTAGVTLRTQGGGTVYYVTSAAVLTTDTWTHIAGVRYGNLLYIFINGTLSGSTTIPAVTLNCSRPLTIGVLDDTLLGAYYTGYIDELRITKGVARYTANFAAPKAPFANSRPSYDPYFSKVSLLLHGDGANNSTSIIDSSPNSKIMSAFGNAKISTSQSKFGSSSMYFDGSGDYLTTSTSTDFALGYDWTLEAWIRPAAYNGVIFDVRTANQCGYWHLDANGKIAVPGGPYSSPTVTHISTAVIALNSWTHVAVCGSLTGTAIFINGVLDSTSSTVSNWATTTQKPYIGIAFDTTSYPFNGYIAGLRITKGIARYTSNFTVPSNQLPAYLPPPDPYYSNVALLLHGEGVNGTSQFTDSSSLPGTLTASGGIAHTTTNKKFGSSSIEVTNNTSKIEVVKNSAIDLTGTYTIEFWARTSTVLVGDANAVLTTNNNAYPNRFVVDFYAPTNTTILGRLATPTNTIIYTTPTQPYVLGSWAHFAFVNNSTANTHTVFINGVVAGSRAAVPLFNTTTFQVGKNGTAWTEGPYQIDDLKITNGIAKYTAAFVPPTLEDTYFDPSFSSVSLLLHGNGSNGSTNVIDSGSNTKLVTVNGNAQISTTQSKFNGSSLKLAATGDRFSIPAHAEFDMGATTLFTIECWFYLNSNSGSGVYPTLISRRSDETTYPDAQWALNFNPLGAGLAFNISNGSGWMDPGPTYTGAINTGAWHHVALVRADTSATGLKLFYDGTLVASSTSNPSLESNSASKPLIIGGYTISGMNGYIDDLRITKGAARYTANFTLPTAPFPDQ